MRIVSAAAVLTGIVWLLSTQLAFPWQELSPFTEVQTEGDKAYVRYRNVEYELLSINGISTGKLLTYCRQEFRGRWAKRFSEDLVRVLSGYQGRPVLGRHVALKLRAKSGELLSIPRAEMTAANRQQVWAARHRTNPSARVVRAFHAELKSQWSYYHTPTPGADAPPEFASAFAKLEQAVTNLSADELHLELQKIIALGIDGHAGVRRRLPDGYAPFLVRAASTGNRLRYVAFRSDRSDFLLSKHPFIESIDDLPIEDWLAAANALIAKGSPQYRLHHQMRYLRHLNWLREELGRPTTATVKIALSSPTGGTKETTLPVADRFPIYGKWPVKRSAVLNGNVGYLRLARMNRDAVNEIRNWMPKFRDGKGLIVDVRGNTGGSREALIRLVSYLMSPDDAPRVVNMARYRLHAMFDEEHLAARFMYRESWDKWSPAEQTAIASFKKTFIPSWRPPADQFGAPHYLVLRHRPDRDVYHFNKPVVVLMDEFCFSATDIFLTGLKGMPKVTLMGTASGGGSARTMGVAIDGLNTDIRVGSMVSYQADGRLFDGQGVQPDIEMHPNPEYHLGGRDRVLQAAVQRILFP